MFVKKIKLQMIKNIFNRKKIIYSEISFNFLYFIFFICCKIHCVCVSKYPCELRDACFFSFLLHIMCQKRPLLTCTHPCQLSFYISIINCCSCQISNYFSSLFYQHYQRALVSRENHNVTYQNKIQTGRRVFYPTTTLTKPNSHHY